MATHRFQLGQRVTISLRTPFTAGSRGVFKIVHQLPAEAGDNMYRIKSDMERNERVVGESKLIRLS